MKILYWIVFIGLFSWQPLHGQDLDSSDGKKEEVARVEVTKDDSGNLLVQFETFKAGEFRIELVNPRGIKSGELLKMIRLSAGEERQLPLDRRALALAGTYRILVMEGERMVAIAKYQVGDKSLPER